VLQSHPPPAPWTSRIITAAVVLGFGAFFTGSALTMGADGFDEATAALRIDALNGITKNVDIAAGTYELSWVTIYNGEPATTGWNLQVRILSPGGSEAFNKTFAWSDELSCFSCSSTYAAKRTGLDRVNLTGGNYTVEVRISFSRTTGDFFPVRGVLSFLSPERVLLISNYLWIGLGFFLAQVGILLLWRRGNRVRFRKWMDWKKANEGVPAEETPKQRKRREKAERKRKAK
jgi:hypothetical protein